MSEGLSDDEWKKTLQRAEAGVNRALQPHEIDELRRKYERQQKGERAKLQRQIAMKKMEQDKKQLREEMGKKGVQDIQQSEDAKKFIDQQKIKQEAEKARGNTEQGQKTV